MIFQEVAITPYISTVVTKSILYWFEPNIKGTNKAITKKNNNNKFSKF